jgi:hypothetical protein
VLITRDRVKEEEEIPRKTFRSYFDEYATSWMAFGIVRVNSGTCVL